MSSSTFHETLVAFCSELRATYPELSAATTRAVDVVSPAHFWRSWQANLTILAERNETALFSERRGILVAPLALTPTLWGEVSETTHEAIWRYLRTLLLEALMEGCTDTTSITAEKAHILQRILEEEREEELISESDNSDEEDSIMDSSEGIAAVEKATEEILSGMSGLKERLQNLIQTAKPLDSSGAADMPPLPEIPEHLRNGKIAKLAHDMMKHFKPEEFGIDPAMLEAAGDNLEGVLKHMTELYQRDPTVLIAGAKRMAERIQRQIMGGSIKQEELIAEAQEFVALFKEHPMFKEAIAKFHEMVGEGGLGELLGGLGGSSTAGAPSERLRAVQERLRKKMATRQAKK